MRFDSSHQNKTAENAIEVQDLTFGYSPTKPVLDGWSAVFPRQSMTAITGTSGRGKSTLLYLMGLMLRPQRGHIIVRGESVARAGDAQKARVRARDYGFVFQDAALDPTRTLLDNITETALYRGQSRRSTERRAHELLEEFHVHIPANRRPGQVSGGQAQRIALCRALLHEPPIILADEPTGNLDPETAGVVVRAMRQQAQAGAAVVVVTHSPEVADACDRKIVL